jgi:hypothetical protein
MDRRERAELDRHITGNYGEDEFPPRYVIRLLSIAGCRALRAPELGGYIKSFDAEANDGMGAVRTGSIEDALVFDTKHSAILFWQQSPKCRPLRPDGKPNRPLTAYDVEIAPL